jgi:hypothetical protein
MLVLLLSTAQAHESDPQYFFLDDSADLLGSAELDSDWHPVSFGDVLDAHHRGNGTVGPFHGARLAF